MTAEYKYIKGFPQYVIYTDGRVLNIKTKKFLKQHNDSCGYKHVTLYRGTKRSRKTFKVHRLVADAFIPNPNNLQEVNHKDENKANNNVWNLEWCTRKYNFEYSAYQHIDAKKCALSFKEALLLPELINRGCSIKLAALLFKTSHITIRKIVAGKRYKHLKLSFIKVPFKRDKIEIPDSVYQKLLTCNIDNTVLTKRIIPVSSVTHRD